MDRTNIKPNLWLCHIIKLGTGNKTGDKIILCDGTGRKRNLNQQRATILAYPSEGPWMIVQVRESVEAWPKGACHRNMDSMNFNLDCVGCLEEFQAEPGTQKEGGYSIDKRPMHCFCPHTPYCMDCFLQNLAIHEHRRWFSCPICNAKHAMDRTNVKPNLWLCHIIKLGTGNQNMSNIEAPSAGAATAGDEIILCGGTGRKRKFNQLSATVLDYPLKGGWMIVQARDQDGSLPAKDIVEKMAWRKEGFNKNTDPMEILPENVRLKILTFVFGASKEVLGEYWDRDSKRMANLGKINAHLSYVSKRWKRFLLANLANLGIISQKATKARIF